MNEGPLVTLSAGQWKIKISIRFLFLFLTLLLFCFLVSQWPSLFICFFLFNTLIWTSRHWNSPVFKHFAEVILPPRPSCHLNWIWTKGLWNHPPVSMWSFTFLSHFYAKKKILVVLPIPCECEQLLSHLFINVSLLFFNVRHIKPFKRAVKRDLSMIFLVWCSYTYLN